MEAVSFITLVYHLPSAFSPSSIQSGFLYSRYLTVAQWQQQWFLDTVVEEAKRAHEGQQMGMQCKLQSCLHENR